MNEYILFAFGIIPLIVLIFLILKVKTPIHYAVLITLAITVIIAKFVLHTPMSDLYSSIGYGVIKGLWPIVIVILGAIYSYNIMLETRSMDVLRNSLANINDDKRIQVLLVSWCFGGFLEAAAGYGTAVAIPIGILITLGINPLKAAIVSLVANSVPTAFGAVGIPVYILAEQLKMPVTTLGGAVIEQLALFNILIPFVMVAIIGNGIKAIKDVFGITLLCGIATLIPQYFVAVYIGAELPAFAGSICSLFVVIIMAKNRKKTTDPSYLIEHQDTEKLQNHSVSKIIQACSIYIMIFVFIILCSPLSPTIKHYMSQVVSTITFSLTNHQALKLKIEWIASPGVLIIFATLLGGYIQGASTSKMATVFINTIKQLRNSIIAITTIVAIATVMDVSGIISNLAYVIVYVTGGAYLFISPVIGTLGTFVTGSDTNSNILFGKLQMMAADKLHVDPIWLAAANTSGATGGKMISPQSIAIAVSATKMEGQSSAIMSGTLKYCAAYIIILGLKVGLIYYIFMG